MSYKIIAQYYKDISFEIPDSKTALLLEKDIKNYRFICDINSEKVKENIIEVSVNLKLSPIDKSAKKIIYVSVNLASLITIEGKVAKEELEKIILIEIPTRIYPNLRSMIVLLFEKSGYKKINIHEKIDFLKLYEQKKNQK
jgi:preprotein translocase subunit SecB